MSSLLYGTLTTKRLAAETADSTDSKPPGVKFYADAAAALVPAEVLALSAFITGVTTTSETTSDFAKVAYDDNAGVLKVAFLVLIAFAALAYVAGRVISSGSLMPLDIVRALLPAGAFVCWGMLTPASGFEVWFPEMADSARQVIAALSVFGLGLVAGVLGYKANQAPAP